MKSSTQKWILVAAARPNFMKIAPLMRAIAVHNSTNKNTILPFIVHTGQHYDYNMSESFFRDLQIPEPDVHLNIGSGTHAEQTGSVMIAFEKVLLQEKPDLVIVVGDVNSTMACALAAVKLHIPIAHVEAGLRSFDRTMPEEINRLITDAMSDFLFTPSPDGDKNLLREGVAKEKIHHVGDIMVDSLLYHLDQAKKTAILDCLNLKDEDGTHGSVKPYALVTLHRPANVDNHRSFSRIIDGLHRISEQLLVVFPMHPRTQKQVHNFGLTDAFKFHTTPDINPGDDLKGQIHAFESFGYLDFLNLMTNATVVLTDSGGIQEETMILNIPCITLRNTTERPITLTEGTNVLVHDNPEKMVAEVEKVLRGEVRQARCPVLWDGRTAERIVQILTR